MTLLYVGELTIGEALPGAAAAAAAGISGINGALPDIQARLTALAAFSPAPINFATQLTLAQSIVTSIQAGITAGLPVPDISAQIAAISALIAELLATVTVINGQLDIVLTFQGLLAAAGVHVYAYSGRADQLGPELDTELAGGVPGGGGGSEACNALALITTVGATWDAMGEVFQVTP